MLFFHNMLYSSGSSDTKASESAAPKGIWHHTILNSIHVKHQVTFDRWLFASNFKHYPILFHQSLNHHQGERLWPPPKKHGPVCHTHDRTNTHKKKNKWEEEKEEGREKKNAVTSVSLSKMEEGWNLKKHVTDWSEKIV